MKKIILFFIIVFPFFVKGETSFFKTKGGTELQFSSSQDVNGNYSLNISYRFYDYLYQRYSFFGFSIFSYNVDSFKSELTRVHNKYVEWVEVAKKNNIRDFEKEIPVRMNSANMYAMGILYPTKENMKAIFKVSNYYPICIIHSVVYASNRYSNELKYESCDWILTIEDIPLILKEIDRIINFSRKSDMEKNKTKDLFK